MDITITSLGALLGLLCAIIFIFLKIPAVYALMLGALLGGLLGGGSLNETINLMTLGAGSMMTTVLRILAAGTLAGTLIKSKAADSIAQSIIKVLGERKALLALSLATMVLTGVGVFVDIAVITVAPIGLSIGHKLNISKRSILLAMVGGGKAGNLISPNPNAIAVATAFDQPLTSVMIAGILPGVFGLFMTFILSKYIRSKGSRVLEEEISKDKKNEDLPSFFRAILGPLFAIILLALRPLFDIAIDPMIALPVGGLLASLFMGRIRDFLDFSKYGLKSMINVAIILIGTGTLAGIIQNSSLGPDLIKSIESLGMPLFMLAPISGMLMSLATASTTSGATVASEVFGPSLMTSKVSNLGSGVMIHSGSTVLDHFPHGSFFHATGGSVNMVFKERIKIIGYESLIGFTMTVIATLAYGLLEIL
ncbi:MAG: SLC13 family permease [Anaerococcus sp.]|nr:SLC13 family permease [Anaerococcus sp.]